MLTNFILLFLFSGVPYYLYLEKTKKLSYEKIFFLSAFLVACGTVLLYFSDQAISIVVIVLLFLISLFSLYKANKTTNLYKLTYYIMFFNAPMLMFQTNEAIYYGISLFITLFGLYLMGKYYEQHYGSANYQSVTGITLVTPYAGFFLTIYLTALALYPPFPNALLFFNAILSSETNVLWYLIVTVIFLGNFFIAMRVMAKTVFGKPNDNVHYVDLSQKERLVHYLMFTLLLILSILGFQELL
jgi:hypothetical protein